MYFLFRSYCHKIKWASPPQLPSSSTLRGAAHFVRRCAAAFAAFLCTSCASRGAFCDIGNKVSYITRKAYTIPTVASGTKYALLGAFYRNFSLFSSFFSPFVLLYSHNVTFHTCTVQAQALWNLFCLKSWNSIQFSEGFPLFWNFYP